ncbi:hypothetical protein [Aestuariibacter sp. A3R04]|uniref:hypothetical protein n=1 Tax=Aestuariibacter sp. A3R04 TaxID=2841571 RepID=UPI001C08B08D|nr:hypothetical protein [Aestuariibacter sp. A3R04]MBU3021242.1 hypothetical protein [Aestuariibacter sp. A3R04]
MLILKRLVLLSLVTCFCINIAYGDEKSDLDTKVLLAKIKKNISDSADKLNVSEQVFKDASDQFSRLSQGSSYISAYNLLELPEFKNPSLYSESEKIIALNNQRTIEANYYGIPVTSLDSFISIMASNTIDSVDMKKGIVGVQSIDDDIEVVVVKCTGGCGMPETSSVEMMLHITGKALDAGVSNFERFKVRFNDNSGSYVKSEIWRMRTFSGAYREREASRPCPSCPFN